MPSKSNKGGNNGGKKKEKESVTTSNKDGGSNSNLTDNQFTVDGMEEAIRDTKISWISKSPVTATETVYKELKIKYPTHVPILLARITALEADKEMSREEQLTSILAVAKEGVTLVDGESLLAYYGIKSDQRPDASTIKSDMDQKKGWLVNCWLKVGTSQADLILEEFSSKLAETPELATVELNKTHTELAKYVDLSSDNNKQTFSFILKHAMVNSLYGKALKMAVKSWEEKYNKETEETIIKLFEKLGWNHCKDYLVKTMSIRLPASYRPF